MADFPSLIQAAATTFADQCTAYAQFRVDPNNNFTARLQAPEIVKQFSGDVTYGKGKCASVPARHLDSTRYSFFVDPRGILFYNSAADFGVTALKAFFVYKRTDGPGTMSTVKVDFATTQGGTPFARVGMLVLAYAFVLN